MKKVKTSHKGRKCRFPNCKQILSIYNHEALCYVHRSCVEEKLNPRRNKL